MKKSLLLLATSFAFLTGYAQNDCATALAITASGTITATAPAGTVEPLCFTDTAADVSQTSPFAARWYKFIPTLNGIVNVSSSITQAAGNSNDTRVSIFSGTCSGLTCVTSQDDISATNYQSTVSFTAVVGTTYYIYWDNFWNAAGFDFDFTFTPVSCLPIAGINNPTLVTTTSATLNWAASPSAPVNGYEVEYGAVGFVQGTIAGTIVAASTNSLALSSLPAGNNYDYYVRAKCSPTDLSAWSSVSTLSLNKTLPYASGLDTSNTLAGWTIYGTANQGLGNSATAAQSPSGYWIFNTAAAPGPNNNWLFTPRFNILAGEQVTLSFYHRATTTARTLRVTAGLTNTEAAQTIVLLNASIAAGTTWTQVTVPAYTFATAGTYVFAFHDNSTATPTTATSMRIDTVSITSVLSTDSFSLNGVTMYPNPATDILNIQSETEELTKVSITDLNGRIVKEVSNNLSQISLENLAKGIYMVTIESATAKKVEKLIVE